jgi:hypothetical protein
MLISRETGENGGTSESRRMLKKAVQQAAASEGARHTLRYVEPLSDARTQLADFFSILLSKENQWQRADQEAGCTIISTRSFSRSVTATWGIRFSRLPAVALQPRL